MPEPMIAPMPSAVSDHGSQSFLQPVLGRFRFSDEFVDALDAEKL